MLSETTTARRAALPLVNRQSGDMRFLAKEFDPESEESARALTSPSPLLSGIGKHHTA